MSKKRGLGELLGKPCEDSPQGECRIARLQLHEIRPPDVLATVPHGPELVFIPETPAKVMLQHDDKPRNTSRTNAIHIPMPSLRLDYS